MILLDPVDIVGHLAVDTWIRCHSAGLDAPRDNADLFVVMDQWATRVATALSLAALIDPTANVIERIGASFMAQCALLVGVDLERHLLQRCLNGTTSLKGGKQGELVKYVKYIHMYMVYSI